MTRKSTTSEKKSSKADKKNKSAKKVTKKVKEEPKPPPVVVKEEPKPSPVVVKEELVDKYDINQQFQDIVDSIDEEIKNVKAKKPVGVKSLKSLNKKVKQLQKNCKSLLKKKNKKKRPHNKNSGFLKPVVVSKEMAAFAGWAPDELHSRVEVTKLICNYIKEHNLQNPEDRRVILADKPLSKLLKYDKNKSEKPLTYYSLQTYLKVHFK